MKAWQNFLIVEGFLGKEMAKVPQEGHSGHPGPQYTQVPARDGLKEKSMSRVCRKCKQAPPEGEALLHGCVGWGGVKELV